MKTKGWGFTLIEALVVISVLSILAGALVPLALKNIEDAKLSSASEDLGSIAKAIANLHADTGWYPHIDAEGDYCRPGCQLYWLYSSERDMSFKEPAYKGGVQFPTNNASTRAPLYNHLILNNPSASKVYTGWKGPYLANDGLDPWGHSYVVFVLGYYYGSDWPYVWVVSAGPDGELATSPNASSNDGTLQDDDVGLLLHIYDGTCK